MLYHSTRSRSVLNKSKEAILKGLANDGGLFVSDSFAGLSFDMEKLMGLSYEDIALRVFRLFLDDFGEEELSDCIREGYGGRFETEVLTPVTRIGDDFLLELYHGPTAAFKDLALSMLPQFMHRASGGKKIMILTATSGDTGKAALEGFRDAPGTGVIVFYPHRGVSDIQYLQMASQRGNNVHVAAVRGDFDDCQTGVKAIFASLTSGIMEAYGVTLSSANSINIGRLVPQVVYYIYAYSELLSSGRISFGDLVDFIVPTGNFGDIFAGYMARMAGLPVGRLIVASNENRVLTDFFETGIYDRNRSLVKTASPSMDILVSSNLERMLYFASHQDAEYTASLMRDLSTCGRFKVNREVYDFLTAIYKAGFVTDADSLEAVREAWEDHGRLIDPHTAVAYRIAQSSTAERPRVILSTASPFKFAQDVYTAIFGPLDFHADGIRYMDALAEKTGENIPRPLAELKTARILHRDVLDFGDMADYVLGIAALM